MVITNTSINQLSVYEKRHVTLAEALDIAGIHVLALNPGPSMTYLTGLHFHLMERPTTMLFIPGQTPTIIIPELEVPKLANLPFQVQAFTFDDDPATWPDAFNQAVKATRMNGCSIGVESIRFRVLELRFLETAAPQARFVSADKVVGSLRICKDHTEISAMRKAVEIAQHALKATLPLIHIGMTEREAAAEMVLQLLRAGTQTDVPFAPIVSGGPNSANPHAFPSTRKLAVGDLLVIDWGASYDGYVSDLTRTFAIGKTTPELNKIYEIVKQANAEGRAYARPGIPAGEVDRITRAVIETAGYGKYFTHRTGHGLGMEGHEDPYIYSANELPLLPGMTFTIEPGIYLPEYNGVRIEDDVVITEDGAESLSNFSRNLTIIE